jgi:hypothetical protein
MAAGFFKAPRELSRLLVDREITPNEWAVVSLLGQLGADRGWQTTSNTFLASTLDIGERTVRRVLRSLRAKNLVEYADHERVALFTVRLSADTLRSLETARADTLRSLETAEPADTPAAALQRKAASAHGNHRGSSADSRARAETETEKERELPPERRRQFSAESRCDDVGDDDPLRGSSPTPLPAEIKFETLDDEIRWLLEH